MVYLRDQFRAPFYLHISGKHLHEVAKLWYAWLSSLSLWLKSNELAPKAEKTKYMIFVPKQNSSATSGIITFDIRMTEGVTHFKFLGVVFQENLRWTDHVHKTSNETSHFLDKYIFHKRSSPIMIKKVAIFYIDPLTHSILYSCLGLNHTI